eukprot:3942654-Heterocapsa_arctica.AAC.1
MPECACVFASFARGAASGFNLSLHQGWANHACLDLDVEPAGHARDKAGCQDEPCPIKPSVLRAS